MGQYYSICNIDKRQFIHPYCYGDGAKIVEFAYSSPTTMTALAILLADGNGRGGGDFPGESELVGHWAGDRIVIAGDYADEGKFVNDPTKNLYNIASEEFEDISFDVLVTLFMDNGLREYYKGLEKKGYSSSDSIRDAFIIYKTDPSEYPLLLGDLKSEVGKQYLEKKIKQLGSGIKQKKGVKHDRKVKA
jgi:hypothetical protein